MTRQRFCNWKHAILLANHRTPPNTPTPCSESHLIYLVTFSVLSCGEVRFDLSSNCHLRTDANVLSSSWQYCNVPYRTVPMRYFSWHYYTVPYRTVPIRYFSWHYCTVPYRTFPIRHFSWHHCTVPYRPYTVLHLALL